MPIQKIRCVIMRAGTSKGVFLHESDLPTDKQDRTEVILKIFGSPDLRQIDGLGGADPLTSKVAIIAPSDCEDYDVRYTYGQVAIDQPIIHTKGICGNISSGVGPFAIDEGLVKAKEPITSVRIYNTNTDKIFVAEVPVCNGRAAVYGDYAIAGVPGTGAQIDMDFSKTAGAVTGKLLPTGNTIDEINVEEIGKIDVSVVDCSTVEVFIRAKDVGLTGIETPSEIDQNPGLLERLERIRGTAACLLGFCSEPEKARLETANSPHLVIVSPVQRYISYLDGSVINTDDIDIVARLIFMQKTHKTYAGTGSFCTAVASLINGTIANEVYAAGSHRGELVRIGHPVGIIEVTAAIEKTTYGFNVKRCGISRTARRIMDGWVYIR